MISYSKSTFMRPRDEPVRKRAIPTRTSRECLNFSSRVANRAQSATEEHWRRLVQYPLHTPQREVWEGSNWNMYLACSTDSSKPQSMRTLTRTWLLFHLLFYSHILLSFLSLCPPLFSIFHSSFLSLSLYIFHPSFLSLYIPSLLSIFISFSFYVFIVHFLPICLSFCLPSFFTIPPVFLLLPPSDFFPFISS